MTNFPPLLTPIVDLKTGLATPFWNKYFTLQGDAESVLETVPVASLIGRGSDGPGAAEVLSLGDRLSVAGTTLHVDVDNLPLDSLLEATSGSLLIGSASTGAGAWQQIALGSGLTMTGTTLSASGSGGTIGGNVGASDNRFVRSDGTGGSTIQGSASSLDDSGNAAFAGLSVNSHTVTVNGAVTLNDWFDQAVKTTSTVTFDAVTASGVDATAYSVGGTPGDSGDHMLALDGGGAIRLKVVNGVVTVYA